MARLNEKDLLLLDTNKTVSMQGVGYAYLGGNFTENPNDYVEVLIYDTNENFLESAVVDSSMYSTYENNKIKLKTGTILRSIGYDRGRYVVKYNFLRRLAGSHENVLIDEDGAIHTGDYHVMPNGTIMTGATHEESTSKPLTLKEYKYFVHEISPSRREVRLAPQRINDSKYIEDFYELQTELKRMESDGTIRFVGDEKDESLQMEYVGEDSNKNFPDQITNGQLVLHNVFSQPLQTHSLTTTEEEEEETEPNPTYPAGGGALPPSTVYSIAVQASSQLYDNWNWGYFKRGDGTGADELPIVGYFLDSDGNGWRYMKRVPMGSGAFTFIPPQNWPPDV